MKKVRLLVLAGVCGLMIVGCGKSELEEKVSEQGKTIESLTAEQATMANPEVGETLTLSGTVVIGEDLKPGVYDVTLPGNEDSSFSLFNDKDASLSTFEWLLPKSETKEESDSLIGYSFKKGEILDISKNLNFTKVR